MTTWTVIRFLHLLGVTFFVGGQLALVVAITPVMRAAGADDAMREAARRFGIGSAVALVVIIATGVAMASHFDSWDEGTLQLKLALVAAVFALTGLHVVSNKRRAISLALVALSVVIVYLGVDLSWS